MNGKRWLGSLMLTAAAVIWGTAFAFQRAGMEHMEPISFNAARMTLAAIAVGLVSLLPRKRAASADPAEEKARRRSTLLGGLCCGAFLTLASLFQQAGMVYTGAGKAGFITALYMLLVPIIQALLFRKRNGWLVWLAVLLGLAGMYLLCMTESLAPARGDALVFACAVFFSGHILCCDHFVSRGDPIRISALQFAVTALLSWIAAFLLESPSPAALASAAVPILYCGLMSGGVGYTLQLAAQKFTEPTVASLLMSLEAVFAVIAGAVMLHERMSGREAWGCAVMFVAIILVQIPLPRKKAPDVRTKP